MGDREERPSLLPIWLMGEDATIVLVTRSFLKDPLMMVSSLTDSFSSSDLEIGKPTVEEDEVDSCKSNFGISRSRWMDLAGGAVAVAGAGAAAAAAGDAA